MYLPRWTRIEDPAEVERYVRTVAAGTLVTVGPDGAPDATFLPVLWEDGEVRAHVARANDQWRRIVTGAPGLLVVTGPDAYVSPGWYATKREHGRVVPTWNYSAVHLRGPVTVHDDPEWLRGMVTRLTDRHEAEQPEPWAVTDAPERYVAGQLRAIVGISLRVESVEAKAKWSQNRSAEDRDGVVEGLSDPAASARVTSGHL